MDKHDADMMVLADRLAEYDAAVEMLQALHSARIALTFYREDMARTASPGRREYPFGMDAEKSARAAIARWQSVQS